MIEYVKPVIMDLINCDERQKAWELIDFYFSHAKSLEDYDTLGYAALKADKRDTYLECAEATYALARTPEQLYTTRINLYKAYNMMNQPEKALHYIDINLQINPEDFETNAQKAFNTSLSGQKEAADKMLEDLVLKHPDKADKMEAAFSGKYLRNGELSRGIKSFIESTDETKGVFVETLRMKKWNGIISPGKTIYVEGAGGIGDEIINIRFLDQLRKLGMRPILYSTGKYRKDIDDLFIRHGFEIVRETFSIDTRCSWVPMMSLPSYMNATEDDLWKGTYLTPLRQSKNKIDSDKFKIGIKCSGNPYFGQDEYRKIPVETMLKYLPEEAEIYYIDKEEKKHPRLIDLSDRIENWEDTLDFIDQMDCIVSSCTSLVHAAGAIGKTTFVAIPIAEYYIWTTSRRDTSTPWYGDNFQIIKQTKVRDWHKPLSEIEHKVREMMNDK